MSSTDYSNSFSWLSLFIFVSIVRPLETLGFLQLLLLKMPSDTKYPWSIAKAVFCDEGLLEEKHLNHVC